MPQAASITDPALTPEQEQVLALLAAGSTYAAAASEARVHRNTIAYWRRTSSAFNQALRNALFEKSLVWHEEAGQMAAKAAETIRQTIEDPKTPAAIRLKAALAILEKASTPPRFPDELPLSPPQLRVPRSPSISLEFLDDEPEELMEPEKPMEVEEPAQLDEPHFSMHKNAQIHHGPKTGRNDPCPCGSGKKFKRCCLDHPSGDPDPGPVPDTPA